MDARAEQHRDAGPLANGIGVLGVGAMGHPIAEHIQRAAAAYGGELLILERSVPHAGDLIAAGARAVRTPRAMAEAAGVIVAMLPDLPQIEAAVHGEDGLLAGIAPGRVVRLVVGSTVAAPGLQQLDRVLRELPGAPLRIVDAPVSGGEEGAKAGALAIMVGGDDEDVALVRPVLEAYGRAVRLGEVGAGQVAKACNQLVVAATVAALGESAVLAERAGIDLAVLFDLLGGGYAASRILETRGRRFVEDDFRVSGAAEYMTKDLRAAAAVSASYGVEAPTLSALHALFEDIAAAGYGRSDISVTKQFTRDRSAQG